MLIMYTKTGCPWCDEAREFLDQENIEFEEREVRGSTEWFKELEDKTGQSKTPTLDLDGDILADAGVSEIEVFLKEKGLL